MAVNQETRAERTPNYDELPQELHDPERTRANAEQVEVTKQAILQAVEAASDQFWEANVKATSPKSRLLRTITFVASTWVVFFAIISAFTVLVGWYAYEVRPFHSVERIAREQKQADAKQGMVRFHNDLANSLLDVGRVEDAQAEFERALELDPLNSAAEKGVVACELFLSVQSVDSPGSDPAVIDEKLSALIAEKPNDTRLSQLYAFQGDYFYYYDPEEAVQSYQTAIELNGKNAVAHRGLSTNYYERGMFDKAEEEAKKAWEAAKWDPLLEANYADTLLANGHYSEAWENYQDVIKWDPNYIWAYHNAAATARLVGDLPYAQLYYEQLIGMLEDKQITSIDRNQGWYSFTTGSHPWTAVYLSEPSEQKYYAYYGLALTSHLMGHTEEAKSYVNKASDLQIDPYVESEVKRLVNYDIELLVEEQEQFEPRAKGFKNTML